MTLKANGEEVHQNVNASWMVYAVAHVVSFPCIAPPVILRCRQPVSV